MSNTPNLFSTAEPSEARSSEAVSDLAQALQPVLEAMLPSLLTLIETPDHVPSALAVLNRSYSTPLASTARQRLRQDPAIAALVSERYWGDWPSVAELAAMPEGSLGQAFGALLQREGIQLIPRPEGLDQLDGDDQYLQLRTRACHDLWHLVTGCPSTLPGEVAISGFTARQLRQPGPALLIAANLLSRAHCDDTSPDLADAISFGLRLGGVCAPLLAQRWEEGWTRPLAQWRHDLGIAEELAFSPFARG